MKTSALLLLLLSLAVSPLLVHGQLSVPLAVPEFSGVARVNEPVRSGVPLPRYAEIFSPSNLRLLRAGVPVPARFTVLGRWASSAADTNAPIRWVLVDFNADVPASGTNVWTLTEGGPGPALPAVGVVESATNVVITTGPARFEISKTRGSLLDAAWLDLNGDSVFGANEQILFPAPDTGPFVVPTNTEYRGANTAPLSTAVEESGPGIVVVRVDGFHRDNGVNQLLRYVTRLTFYAGRSWVKVNHTIIEGRVAGSGNGDFPDGQQVTPFSRAGLRLRLALSGAVTARVTADSPTPRSFTLAGADTAAVRQRTPTNYTQLAYEVRQNNGVVETGARARQALLDLADPQWGLAVTTRDFYRKGPQQLTGAADGTVTVEFPSEAYTIYQAMGLNEEVLLNFHAAATPFATLFADGQGFGKDPLFAVAPAAWYCGSGAFLELTPAPATRHPAHDSILAQHYQQTLAWAEEGRSFGLLNWLDMPIDRYAGDVDPHDVPYGNSYYDAPGAEIREFARRADFLWLRNLAFPQIRHWFTTDCFDTDDPAHAFNGISGSRGIVHRGGFSGEYHYMESLWDYYNLTGDRRALERGLAAARSYAFSPAWRNDYDLGLPGGPGLTGRMISQKLNTLVESFLASGDATLRARLVADAEDFLTVVGTPEGFFRGNRQQTSVYAADQAFMATLLFLPSIWKYHELTGSPAAREKLILTPQRILNHNRLSANPAAPGYLQFYNQLTVTTTGGGNYTTAPFTPFGNTDDYMYDEGMQGLVTALCRAAALSGDRALMAQARLLYENRLLPGWFAAVWDKTHAQQTLRAAPGLAYLDAPDVPPPSQFLVAPHGNGRFRVFHSGTLGHPYLFQFSTDLTPNGWITLSTNTPGPGGVFEASDLTIGGVRFRFYRVVKP